MSTAELKSSLHKLIEDINDPQKLQLTFNLLKGENTEEDLWDSLSAEEKAAIEEGLDDLENGRIYTHEEVKKQMKVKFPYLFK